MDDLKNELKKNEQGAKFIEEALGPLKGEKEKARMMVMTLAPHRERELKL